MLYILEKKNLDYTKTYKGSLYPGKQWAAVSTQSLLMRDPPQWKKDQRSMISNRTYNV